MPRLISGSSSTNIIITADEKESVENPQKLSVDCDYKPWLEEDVFLPASMVERPEEFSRPGFVLGGSVDRRSEQELSTANEFQTWISDQVIRFKDFLNQPKTSIARRAEFFENARKVVAESKMSPTERAKTNEILRYAENLLDRS